MARAKTGFWTRSLDKLRGAFLHAPPEPASRGAAKKAAQPAAKRTTDASAGAETTAAAKAPDEKTPRKKIPAQPWYRHRQRW